jgi:hypothetical protein
MHKWYYGGLMTLICLALVGCAERLDSAKPAEAMAQLQAGRTILGCREFCLPAWRRVQPQAAQLVAGARWQDLALLVMRIAYQDDLSLYYLGRAAEGLGYQAAAAGYYRQSTQVSGTPASCQNLSRLCAGVALPRTAALRAAAVERELNRARPRRAGPAPPGPETPAGALEDLAAPAPSPVASPAGPAPSEYIEPPPATR